MDSLGFMFFFLRAPGVLQDLCFDSKLETWCRACCNDVVLDYTVWQGEGNRSDSQLISLIWLKNVDGYKKVQR